MDHQRSAVTNKGEKMSLDEKLTIKIACEGAMVLEIDDIDPYQDDLKELSEIDYGKLRAEILEEGFSFCLDVWFNPEDQRWKTIDGHQRLRVLKNMRDAEFFHIPPIPCSIVLAENVWQAKKKILSGTAQYGKMTNQGLYKFSTTNMIALPQLEKMALPIAMPRFVQEFFEDPATKVPPAPKEGAQEFGEGEFSKFEHTCPKCGFGFNGAK
jgi:hypothetical protein